MSSSNPAKSSSATTPPSRPSLLTLPRELRFQIIHHVICPPKTLHTYTNFGTVYTIHWGGADPLDTTTSITRIHGLPTILAVNRELQYETLFILYEILEVYFENGGPPDPCDPSILPRHWQPPRLLLDFFSFRKIRTAVVLHPACPTRSTIEPMLRSAQRHGLRTTEHAWFLNTLADLFSPLHTQEPLKSLRLEIQITWDMMDTVESVAGFERMVEGLSRLRGIETVDFVVKDKTEKGKRQMTLAYAHVKAILLNVKEAIKEGVPMPERTHVYMRNDLVVVVNELQKRPERRPERPPAQRIWERRNAIIALPDHVIETLRAQDA